MLRTYFQETFYDMPIDMAQKYADVIREAILTGKAFEGEKKKGYFLSRHRGFEDKLYVGNIHRIENHLYWNDEELQEDDEIVNVVVIDGPVTRDGDGCSYGSKDHRDQILYANTIPQVKGHIFILNTPGGSASARIDYEQAFADCREKGKPTVAWVDGLCCSAGQLVASLCDRTIVMNGRHTMGCIGTMCAFWGVPNGTTDQDGYRYIELVSVSSPDKNSEYREAVDGKTEKLQAELDKLGEEFRETVRQNRPKVKDEHLTGKTFDADEVMGALVDEIGDYSRAIEAVFELANGTLPAARTIVDDESVPGNDAGEQEDMSALNEQQKAAISTRPGETVIVDDGSVKTVVETMFGEEEQELAKPKTNEDMTNKEKEAAEATEETIVAQPTEEAATAETTAEQPAEGAPTEGQPAEQPAEETPTDEQPAEEPAEEPSTDEQPAEEPAEETPTEGQPAEQPAEEVPSEETLSDAQAEIDRITETLCHAEALVAERDKTIAERDATIASLDGAIEERDAAIEERDAAHALVEERDKTIESLQATIARLEADVAARDKSLAEKEAELKEIAGTPTPMLRGESPADNGVGPKVVTKTRIRRGMSYSEIQETLK